MKSNKYQVVDALNQMVETIFGLDIVESPSAYGLEFDSRFLDDDVEEAHEELFERVAEMDVLDKAVIVKIFAERVIAGY